MRVPDGSIDPGSLEGDALARWYLRSPAEIEQERQAAAEARYREFFGAASDGDSDQPSDVGSSDTTYDDDAASAPATPVSGGSAPSWVQVAPNKWRGVTDDAGAASVEPLPSVQQDDGGSQSGAALDQPDDDQNVASADASASDPDPTLQIIPTPDGELTRPPEVKFAPIRPPSTYRPPPTPILAGPNGARATPAQAPGRQPRPALPELHDHMISYGALRAPAPSDQQLAELRRQQAAFGSEARKIDLRNSLFAIPALAPAATVLGLEGAAAIAGHAVGAAGFEAPLNFVEREAWQRGAQAAGRALSNAERSTLRSAARAKFARANGISASEMQAEVHHSDPLEWAHLKPNADPNRLANLWGLRGEAHDIATRAWADFDKSLNGRIPSAADLMEAKLRIDRLVEPFIRRAGVPRSRAGLRKGGPL
jgi:hypothetical protein